MLSIFKQSLLSLRATAVPSFSVSLVLLCDGSQFHDPSCTTWANLWPLISAIYSKSPIFVTFAVLTKGL